MRQLGDTRLVVALLTSALTASCLSGRIEDTLEPQHGGPEARTEFRLAFLQVRLDRYIRGAGAPPQSMELVLEGMPDKGKEDLRVDGWGRPVAYVASAGTYELRSAGEDGVFGTGDDLVYTGPQR